MNNEFKNYYRILGVTTTASITSIEKARERELERNWNNPAGRLQIEEAYKVLSNRESRRKYDEELNSRLTERERAIGNAVSYESYKKATSIENKQNEELKDKIEKRLNGFEKEPEKKVEEVEEIESPKEKKDEEKEIEVKEELVKESEEPKKENMVPVNRDLLNKWKQKEVNIGKTVSNIVKSEPAKKIGKGLFVAGSIAAGLLVVGGIPGLAAGGVVALIGPKIAKSKLGQKGFNLVKKGFNNRKIEWKAPEEVQLIEQYNKTLENQIFDLLSKPHNSYELEIARLKYVNQIELLSKRIEFKRSEIRKKGNKLVRNISLYSLEKQLEKSQEKLQELENYIEQYNKSETKSFNDQRMNKLNENLNKLDKELKDVNKKSSEISKLEIKRSRALKNRDKLANKLVLHKNGIVSKVMATVKLNRGEQEFVEQQSYEMEENVKTR